MQQRQSRCAARWRVATLLLVACTLMAMSTLQFASGDGTAAAAAAAVASPTPLDAAAVAALLSQAGVTVDARPTGSVQSLTLPNGSTYSGQLDDVRQPHGNGVVTDPAGALVEGGQWVHGQLTGPGVRVFADGSRYVGSFEGGASHGQGAITFADGSSFRGQFACGQMEGTGTHTATVDGQTVTYEGQFKDGKKHGLGHEQRGSGFFEGEWSQGHMHGFGLVHVANEGIARIGRWQDGHYMHETPVPRRVLPRADFLGPDALAAEYIGLDGGAVTYVGDRNALGEPHGAGDMLSAAGAKLQGGSWEGGLLHGKGYAASSDQSVYTGEFSRGMMHGEGELLWSDGDTFTGRFADDKRAGFGTMRHASDGSVYEGEWRDDSMHGHGVIVWQQDGAVCEANFRNNDRHGFGAVWNGQGLLVGLGKWEEDELVESGPVRTDWFTDGRVLTRGERDSSLLYPDHTHYTGPLDEDDKPHGLGTLRDHAGAVISNGTWEHGLCVQGQCAEIAAAEPDAPQVADVDEAAVNTTANDAPAIVRDEL